jgi:hypothetical protein
MAISSMADAASHLAHATEEQAADHGRRGPDRRAFRRSHSPSRAAVSAAGKLRRRRAGPRGACEGEVLGEAARSSTREPATAAEHPTTTRPRAHAQPPTGREPGRERQDPAAPLLASWGLAPHISSATPVPGRCQSPGHSIDLSRLVLAGARLVRRGDPGCRLALRKMSLRVSRSSQIFRVLTPVRASFLRPRLLEIHTLLRDV